MIIKVNLILKLIREKLLTEKTSRILYSISPGIEIRNPESPRLLSPFFSPWDTIWNITVVIGSMLI